MFTFPTFGRLLRLFCILLSKQDFIHLWYYILWTDSRFDKNTKEYYIFYMISPKRKHMVVLLKIRTA